MSIGEPARCSWLRCGKFPICVVREDLSRKAPGEFLGNTEGPGHSPGLFTIFFGSPAGGWPWHIPIEQGQPPGTLHLQQKMIGGWHRRSKEIHCCFIIVASHEIRKYIRKEFGFVAARIRTDKLDSCLLFLQIAVFQDPVHIVHIVDPMSHLMADHIRQLSVDGVGRHCVQSPDVCEPCWLISLRNTSP